MVIIKLTLNILELLMKSKKLKIKGVFNGSFSGNLIKEAIVF